MTEVQEEATAHKLKHPRRRFKSIALSLVILLCGVIIGSGLTILFLRSHILSILDNPSHLTELAANRLAARLGLEEDQRAAVYQILQERQESLQKIRATIWPEIEAQNKETYDRISALLNEDQQAELAEMYAYLEEVWSGLLPPGTMDHPSE